MTIPKLRTFSYIADWQLQRPKDAEVRADHSGRGLLLGGVNTRRMDKLVKTMGIELLTKSQVSRMVADLDAVVDDFRHRRLGDAGPFTFVAAYALTMTVREGRRAHDP